MLNFKSVAKKVVALSQISVMAGLTIVGLQNASQATDLSIRQQVNSHPITNRAIARDTKLANGVYLYGQATQPDQVGSTYMVFEVNNGNVVGVMYMPSSSFDCFQGALQADRLAFNLVDSYSRKIYAASIPLESSPLVASSNGLAIAGIRLQGFHPINKIAANDQRMLNTCKADFRK